MIASMDEPNNRRTFVIEDREWYDQIAINQKIEDLIAWKLVETFTEEELRRLIKIDMKKVEKMVVEKIAEKVVNKYLKSEAFKEEHENS